MDELRLLDLLDALVDGALDDAGRAELEELLLDSAEARRVYWEYLRQHAMVRELLMEKGGSRLALGAAGRAPAVRRPKRLLIAFAVAAAAAAVLIAAVPHLFSTPPRSKPSVAGQLTADSVLNQARYPLAYGQPIRTLWDDPVEVRLADESVLTVSPESCVSVPERRRVKLISGAVRVKCRPEEKKSFEVVAEGVTARALGTEFVVVADEHPEEEGKPVSRKLVSVVVLSGVVLLVNKWGELRLTAGEVGVSPAGAKPEKSKIAARVKQLIALLAHEEFKVRQKASKELGALADVHGGIVIPLCEAAFKTARDPEVRERLKAFKDPGATRGPTEILAAPETGNGELVKPRPPGWRPPVGSGIAPGVHCEGVVSLGINRANVPGRARGRVGLLDPVDVDGDGKPEILAHFANSIDKCTWVYACKPDGSAAKGFPLKLKGVAAPRMADIDGDGKLETIRLLGNQVHAQDLAGKPLKGFPANVGGGTYRSMDVADISGNGKKEIIVTRWMQRELKALDCNGKVVKGFPVKFPAWKDNVMYTLAFAGVDKGYKRKHIVTLHGGAGLTMVNGFGRFARGWPVSVQKAGLVVNYISGAKACGDITGDGVDEVFALVGKKQGGGEWQLLALDRSGKPLEGWPREWSVVSPKKAMFGGRDMARGLKMSFGDVDGDGKNEAVWVDAAAYLHAAKANGLELEGYPRPVRHGNKQRALTRPMLWDLNGDKAREIIYLVHGAEGDGYTLCVYDKAGKEIAGKLGLKLSVAGEAIEDARMADLDGDGKPEIVCFTKPGKYNRATMWNRKVMAFSLKAGGKK